MKTSEIMDVEECSVESLEVAWWDLTEDWMQGGRRETDHALLAGWSRRSRLVRGQLFCRN